MNIIKNLKPKQADEPPEPKVEITGSINEDAAALRKMFDNSADLTLKTMHMKSGGEVLVASLEGLADKELITLSITNRIADCLMPHGEDVFTYVQREIMSCGEIIVAYDLTEAAGLMMSGFACVIVSGCKMALCAGVQGYAYRSVDEPPTEVLQRGSREGFCEPMKVNQAMLRRRLKTPKLKFETLKLGQISQTDVCICYIRDKISSDLLDKVKQRLNGVKLESLIASGYLAGYLDAGGFSFFNGVGVTERPDVCCSKLCEGKVAIIVDGSPSVLVVPHMMSENFTTLDDYCNRPYFSVITRWLKYAAFAVSILLPGIYVALATFDPEFLPGALLTRVVTSVSKTPFSAFAEVLLFTFIYEIMREAGLRLPKSLGHAVSIIGGLVIGDTAVSSGFIGAPTLMIVALTVICSYVIPSLYAPISILRLLFIIAGGVWGMWGIALMICLTLVDLCSKQTLDISFAAGRRHASGGIFRFNLL